MKIELMNDQITVNKVVARYELDPISPPEKTQTSSFYFVVDILNNTEQLDSYFPKVYRREFFSILPSSFRKNVELEKSDEFLLVEDSLFEWENLRGQSPEEVLKEVLKVIEDKFNGKF